MTISDMEIRYYKALGEIETNDVLVFDNYEACCFSCASYELENEYEGKDFIYFIEEQGMGLTWNAGKPFNFEVYTDEVLNEEGGNYEEDEVREETPATEVSWLSRGPNADRVTYEAFRNNGFEVQWNGPGSMPPTVFFVDKEAVS